MSNGNRRDIAPTWDRVSFATTIREWLDDHDGLLNGIDELRCLGDEGAVALDAVMNVREVKKFRLGWELWEAMLEGDGVDPEVLLDEHVPYESLELGRRALWGEESSSPSLTVVRDL